MRFSRAGVQRFADYVDEAVRSFCQVIRDWSCSCFERRLVGNRWGLTEGEGLSATEHLLGLKEKAD